MFFLRLRTQAAARLSREPSASALQSARFASSPVLGPGLSVGGTVGVGVGVGGGFTVER